MTDLTDKKIADLRQRITPGPWRAVATGGADDLDEVFADDLNQSVADAEGANAEAIALVPDLLAEVARLRAVIAVKEREA